MTWPLRTDEPDQAITACDLELWEIEQGAIACEAMPTADGCPNHAEWIAKPPCGHDVAVCTPCQRKIALRCYAYHAGLCGCSRCPAIFTFGQILWIAL